MKRLIVFLGLGLFGLQCTKTEIVTALFLPCDCQDIPIAYENKGVEGIIFFPRKPSEPYRLFVPSFGGGDPAPSLAICSDSLSLSLIKTQKITDSSRVLLNGGIINYNPTTTSKIACGEYAAFRITNLVKIR